VAFAALTVADTDGAGRLAVKRGVRCPEIQIRVIKEHRHRNGADLAALRLAKLIIERVADPATLSRLNLRGNGELVVLFWQSFSVFLNNFANGDAPHGRRRYGQTFDHFVFLDFFDFLPASPLPSGYRGPANALGNEGSVFN
jgi:hypothetical protein